jgi:very-short-patch-repair endonuclease/DNA polymerase III delta prime subunit
MKDTILSKLEASRQELLDLGMRNPLLNYKTPSSKGIHVVEEQSVAIYDILVKEGRSMSFLPTTVKDQTNEDPSPANETDVEDPIHDSKLQTNDNETVLLKRLSNTFYAARTSLEEQGVNILYLALGMLHWYESDSSQEERRAPLVLVPVQLDRTSVRERTTLKYTQDEIGENVSLRAKMKLEFDLEIPEIEHHEDFDIHEYFQKTAQSIEKFTRWKVEPDEIELGFFSFNKFLIYTDLDNSKWPENKKPADHPLLQSIFNYGFQDHTINVAEDAQIDRETQAHEFFQVIDADSSQILAMVAAREGKNLLIQGPPGTGKSQTITNLIADAVGRGKKVLFVAEKMAALDVVKTKLDRIGLGEICLELHSNKTNKKGLFAELIRVMALTKPNGHSAEQKITLLKQHRDELNDYCDAVNTNLNRSPLTLQQITGKLLQVQTALGTKPAPKIDKEEFKKWDHAFFQRAEAVAERIQARLGAIGIPEQLIFWGSRLFVVPSTDLDFLTAPFEAQNSAISSFLDEVSAVATAFGLPPAQSLPSVDDLLEVARIDTQKPNLHSVNIVSPAWLDANSTIKTVIESGQQLQQLQERYAQIFLPSAWKENILASRLELINHGKKWYRSLIPAYKRAKKHLASLCRDSLPKEHKAQLRYFDDILLAQEHLQNITDNQEWLRTLYNEQWKGANSSFDTQKHIADYLHSIQSSIRQGKLPPAFLDYLSKNPDPSTSRDLYTTLKQRLAEYLTRVRETLDILDFDEKKRFPDGSFLALPLSSQKHLIEEWLRKPTDIHKIIQWNILTDKMDTDGFQSIVAIAAKWPPASTLLKTAVEKNWYQHLLDETFTASPPVRQFQRDSHEEVIHHFRKADRSSLELNRHKVASIHWDGLPGIDSGGQVNILKREFNKRARFKPIRKVVEEAGLALQAIKPVFMMSPLSIANFLPPASVEFDLVIFDEASQVRPVDALGAIIRAKQLIVVGDNKQLPPTSFFDSLSDEIEDEENVTAEIQSILAMCHAQGMPSRMLKWHYRSKHESLITLSNHEFYDDKLVIFPSPGSKQRLGLFLNHLKDTAYDRGKTRTNPKEAQAVARQAIDHAQKHPTLSLGVVAFSSAQREAIETALELLRKENPETESFFTQKAREPFFVKNLENVQGDERDVIFISVGYGRTQDGYLSRSFGPLNNDGGERRLNVLITRAKLRCEIFSNITAADIDLTGSRSRGLATLKHFLHYAETGRLNIPEETGLPADSPFEESVADKLANQGYIVRKQIGSSGFYIDLAIVDPENPGRYLLGIECDGAAYHSARSARDRDRLRQEVLEAMGWKIHRIWSTDWLRHQEDELQRVINAIEDARRQLATDDDAEAPAPEQPSSDVQIERDQSTKESFAPPPYKTCTITGDLLNAELHLYPVGHLAEFIHQVVREESPVHFDEMAHRITDFAGLSKVGSRIKEALTKAVNYLHRQKTIKVKGDFLWSADMETPIIRDRSTLDNGSRKMKYIPPEEIQLALIEVVAAALAIAPDEAPGHVVRLFGFNRLTDEMRSEILPVIDRTITAKKIILESGFLKPADT